MPEPPKKNTKTDLDLFRTRWLRWLGAMARFDKPLWTELLNNNWSSWAHSTLIKHGQPHSHIRWSTPREEVKRIYSKAIKSADMSDLYKLDNVFCNIRMDNRFRNSRRGRN